MVTEGPDSFKNGREIIERRLTELEETSEMTLQIRKLRYRDVNSFSRVTQPLSTRVIRSIKRQNLIFLDRGSFCHWPPSLHTQRSNLLMEELGQPKNVYDFRLFLSFIKEYWRGEKRSTMVIKYWTSSFSEAFPLVQISEDFSGKEQGGQVGFFPLSCFSQDWG